MGVLWLIQISAPASSPWLTTSVNFTPLYFWLSLALNLSMTLAIVARLLVFRWRIARALGPKFGSQYTSIAAMVVESAFISSAGFLLFLIPFGLNSPLANMFIQVLSEIQVCFRFNHLFNFSFIFESDHITVVDYIPSRVRRSVVQKHNPTANVTLQC